MWCLLSSSWLTQWSGELDDGVKLKLLSSGHSWGVFVLSAESQNLGSPEGGCAADLLFMTMNTSQYCFLGFQDLCLGMTGASFFAFGAILVKRHAIHLKS